MWALDELERVVGAEGLASSPGRHAGGEWDYILSLPRCTRRRLVGAGYMRRTGMSPDELEALIVPRVSGVETTDEAMAWYVRTCLVAIGERRTLARRRRHHRLARRNGFSTYFEYREFLAAREGHASHWHERKHKGWT